MRIVGGLLKGRVLLDFSKIGIRPTSDMTRESLFNILQNDIYGSSFLDLCAGTGAVGIEAFSRGAKNVTLNDNSRESIKLIEKNLEKLSIKNEIKVTSFDAVRFIETCTEKFDIIFIDPPYESGLEKEILERIDKILAEDGVVIYETEKPLNEAYKNVKMTDKRKYGRAHLTFYKRGEN